MPKTRTATTNPAYGTTADATNVISAGLVVHIDGHQAAALVDTVSHFCIISLQLADRLRKVKMPWHGSNIRAAGGQLMTPFGKCMAQLFIAGSTFVTPLDITHEHCNKLILGIDFLRAYGTVINIRDRSVTFTIKSHTATEKEHQPPRFRIARDKVILPPRRCSLVSVHCDTLRNSTGIPEPIKELALFFVLFLLSWLSPLLSKNVLKCH